MHPDAEPIPLEQAKSRFLWCVGVSPENTDEAWSNSWKAAVQRNKIYDDNAAVTTRRNLATRARGLSEELGSTYKEKILHDKHVENIKRMNDDLTSVFGTALYQASMRFGTTQKFFNMYLKFLWCFSEDRPEPPDCPLDRVVQRSAKLKVVNWTAIDSGEEYSNCIGELRAVASRADMSLAEWELRHGWRRS